jgi:hypothetical protein
VIKRVKRGRRIDDVEVEGTQEMAEAEVQPRCPL